MTSPPQRPTNTSPCATATPCTFGTIWPLFIAAIMTPRGPPYPGSAVRSFDLFGASYDRCVRFWTGAARGGSRPFEEMTMRSVLWKSVVATLVLTMSGAVGAGKSSATGGVGPGFRYIGPLAIGPDETLFVADS